MKQTIRKYLALLLALTMLCALYVPALADPEEEDEDSGPEYSITLSAETLTLYRNATSATLTATVNPADPTVEWSSSDEEAKIIRVSPTGNNSCMITVVATEPNEDPDEPYKVTVTATVDEGDRKVEETCTVNVYIPEKYVTGLSFPSGNPTSVTSGERAELRVFVSPGDATYRAVRFTSGDPGLVKLIDPETGKAVPELTIEPEEDDGGNVWVEIKAEPYISGQQVRIYAESVENSLMSASHLLTVEAPQAVTGIALSDDQVSIPAGKTYEHLIAYVLPEGAADQQVSWKSSDPSVVKVEWDRKNSTEAKLTAGTKTTGSTPVTITAQTNSGGYEAKCLVYVTSGEEPVKSVTLTPTRTMNVGDRETLNPVIEPAYAFDRSLKWTSSDPEIASVTNSGEVAALKPGVTTITAAASEGTPGTCEVTVSGVVLEPDEEDFPLPAGGSATLTLRAYGLAKNITSWNWASSNMNIARVVGGSASAQVTGVTEGTATIAVTGGGYSDSCQIEITNAEEARNIDADSFFSGGQLNFSGRLFDELQTACGKMTNGRALDYIVNVTVPTAQGTLFDHYVAEPDPGAGISSSTRYYASENNSAGSKNLIKNIYFVPRSGYNGSVTISYNGVADDGNQYSGTITLTRPKIADVQYTSFNGAATQFKMTDFAEYVQKQAGRSMRYVTFELPASRYGTLQYYSIGDGLYEREVSADMRLYTGIAPLLDDVWFVPNKSNQDDVNITFHAYDSNGTKLTDGTVTVLVTTADTVVRDGTNLSYTVPLGERLYFDVNDFIDACAGENLDDLNYIYFRSSSVSSSRGTLYYGNSSRVSTGSSYPFYRNGSGSRRTIESLYFQAGSGTSAPGTTSLSYTGVDVKGDTFTGTIRITVTSGAGTELYYSAGPGQRVWLSGTDFSNASYSATDRELNYIRFNTLPSDRRGKLYSLTSDATTGQNYYYAYSSSNSSRRLIDDLNFVPATDFTGTVIIPYTGYNTNGRSFTGTVTIYIAATPATPGSSVTERDPNSAPLVYTSRGEAVQLRAADFQTDAADKLDYALASVKFTQPNANAGRLCTNYVSPTLYTPLDITQSYSPQMLSNIWFLPRAGFSGSAAVPFFATDITGKSYAGTLVVQVAPAQQSGRFDDMYTHPWAIQAVEFLANYGVVEGTGGRNYSPAAPMKRGDFVLMLSRAFSFPYYGEWSFDDVPSTSYYAAAIASAKALGIATGETRAQQWGSAQSMFRPEETITREEAGVLLYRSMRRTGTMPVGTRQNLAAFSDGGSVSDNAVEAMASLVMLGVFVGDDFGRLNPQSRLTRAEMAVIFHRAIT